MSAAPGRPRIPRALVAFAVLSLTCGSAAAADPPHDASSREAVLFLYTQGKELFEAGKVREACAKFEDARQLDPSAINLLLHLGDCYEKLGRTASAHAQYVDAAAAAARTRDKRLALAAEKAHALEPLLPRLTLEVPPESDLPGLVILRDGAVVPREELGKARILDPGPHELLARAPGKIPWREHRDVPPAGAALVVTIPPLVDAPPQAPEPEPDASAGARRTAGIVAGAMGLVGIGIGAAFGIKAIDGKVASNDGHCDAQSFCDPRGYTLRLDARQAGTISTAAMATGAVFLAGGAALFFTARPRLSAGKAALGLTLFAAPAPGGGHLGLRGAL